MSSPVFIIAKKELLHIVRDRGAFFIVLVIPVVMSVILSLILSTDVRNVSFVAVAPSHSQASMSLVSRIESNPIFQFKGYVGDLSDAERMMRTNDVNAAIILRPDFEELVERIKSGDASCPSPVQIATDASNCAMGSAASLYLKAAIMAEFGQKDEYFSDRMLYNPRLMSSYTFQPGIICFIIMLIGVILTSSAIVREKEYGTVDAVTLSPAGEVAFYTGKLIPYLFLGLLVASIALVTGVVVTGVPVRGSILVIALVTVLYIVTSLLLGLLVALFTSSQTSAYVICWGAVILPVMYCGGVIVPVDNLPSWAQKVSEFVYVRWYVDAIKKLMIQGVSAIYVAREVGYMSMSTAVFLLACHVKIRIQNR